MDGVVFDIAECSLHDGPGMRMAVFLKGCPLRCNWCHSPEGQLETPEILHFDNIPDRICGKVWSSEKLAEHINRRTALLPQKAVTFTGGEPLMQHGFLTETVDLLSAGTHILLDTCGFAENSIFMQTAEKVSHVYFGLKMLDEQDSVRLTKVSNQIVLENLFCLDRKSKTPYSLRIPFLHGLTDTKEYLRDLQALCEKLERLGEIWLLPSNRDAGAKYNSCGRVFEPMFDPQYLCTVPENIKFKVPLRVPDRNAVE